MRQPLKIISNMAFSKLGLLVLIFVLCGCGKKYDEELSEQWRGFARGLMDRNSIARLDVPGSELVSSYDPTGGNTDYNHFLRKGPEKWKVIADLKGPGYVSRLWCTGYSDGNQQIRFYFDGEEKPRIDATLEDYFHGREQQCWLSYLPVPYAKSLVIMTREENAERRLFHQVNWCRWPEGAAPFSFPPVMMAEDKALADELREEWEGAVPRKLPAAGEWKKNSLKAAPGKVTEAVAFKGPAVIAELKVTPDFSGISSSLERSRMLRQLMLEISWDGNPQPSVSVPLGDFFGSVWRMRRYDSMFFGAEKDTFRSSFPMPFLKTAVINIRNTSSNNVPLVIEAALSNPPSIENMGYFHACWKKTGPESVGSPHLIVAAKGRGKYVGCVLSVTSLDKSWWILEGDEIIRTDGEMVPSWKGTGLEDYFNCGWYYHNPAARPLHGIIFKAPFRTIQYRLHLNDTVEFNESLEMIFERGPDHASKGTMESTAYYYMDAPHAAASDWNRKGILDEPANPLEHDVILSELINQERLDDLAGALNHVSEYIEKYPESPYLSVMKLRKLAYERELGLSGTDQLFAKIVDPSDKEAFGQANALDWFYQGKDRALLGIYCNARSTVFIDGKQVAIVDHPERLFVQPLTLKPGPHILSIESKWSRNNPWLQICLKTHGGDVYAAKGAGWKWTREPSDEWKELGSDDSKWSDYVGDGMKGPPNVPYIRLVPNAFILMQHKAHGMLLPYWDKNKDTMYLRKKFDFPVKD